MSALKVIAVVITDFSKIKEPNDITYAAMEKSEQNEDIYGSFETVTDLMNKKYIVVYNIRYKKCNKKS